MFVKVIAKISVTQIKGSIMITKLGQYFGGGGVWRGACFFK